ncbi:HD domain-containing protein, partial [Candidatus Sumerlaeota bacterium]|nr:HD domain-containing protein [Candidatus Sumerlaeota bacterium]
TSSYNLALTLEIILDQIAAQLEVDAAAILAFNPKENALHYSSFRGFHKPPANTIAVPANHSCAGKAVENRDLLFISNLKNHDSKCATAQTLFPSEGFVSYCVAPLIAKGKVLGAVEVFHRDTLQPSADWKEFFEVIAGQAAIAMDGAATFDELQRSNSELAFAYDATLRGWVNALDLRDKETEGHTQRVTEMTVRFARTLEVSEDDLIHIQRGALLHDIGKLGIPDQILLKPGPLTEDEWKVMRKHPVYAYQWLSRIPYLRPALEIPYCHHEKWDGTGYPRGLKGEEIPIAARMFALVDVWDALRSDRPYRAGWPAEKVKEHLQSQSGLHFDPRLTQTFINTVN